MTKAKGFCRDQTLFHRRRFDAASRASPASLRDIMLAAMLGAGPVADAFFVALRLPNHFRAIFAEGAFNAAFVPAYARVRDAGRGGPGAALRRPHFHTCCLRPDRAARSRARFHAGSDSISWRRASTAIRAAIALAVELTRITFPYLLLITLVTLYGGILNSMHRFAAPAAAPILLNLSMMAALGARRIFSDRRACRGLGRADRGHSRTGCCCSPMRAGRACAARASAGRSSMQMCANFSAHSAQQRSAPPACSSRCLPIR